MNSNEGDHVDHVDASKNIFLEDVNIKGFKSFSEKTDMTFQPGIGVIIGNNGVGKSNILDAIVWALGEDDLSRLRCHDNEELFFSGSKDYPPASKIRVELNFRIGDKKTASIVQLVRDMTKDGLNNYWIQEKPYECDQYRRKSDELNLKHSLKTIVRQEQINDMILLSPHLRFQWMASLFGADLNGDLSSCLQERIDPLFREYLRCLMPQSEGGLRVHTRNGRQELEIEVAFSKYRIRKAHQLSGGEKSVTSLALKLAVFDQLESPFYLLDEVEPSLDYTNHKSMQALLKSVARNKQLIMVTHLRSTIELANTLHGVRTRWDGSSFMKFYFVMNERLLRLYKCC
jgi:chromosome segregation protein